MYRFLSKMMIRNMLRIILHAFKIEDLSIKKQTKCFGIILFLVVCIKFVVNMTKTKLNTLQCEILVSIWSQVMIQNSITQC